MDRQKASSDLDKNRPRFAIIGAGNLGLSLADAFHRNGYQVKVGTRTGKKPIHLPDNAALDDDLLFMSPEDAANDADCILLTVSDDKIEQVCDELSDHFDKNSLIAHCSGALDSEILASAKNQGCITASLHPLNTFPSPQAGIELLKSSEHNTALYYEGDCHSNQTDEINIFDKSISAFTSIGFKPIPITKESKPLYHAACVIACNLLTALMEVSLQTAEAAKLDRDEFWESIHPLVQVTLSNISEHGTAGALSGPVARGDVGVVKNQIESISNLGSNHTSTYKYLSTFAKDLASSRMAYDSIVDHDLETLLKET